MGVGLHQFLAVGLALLCLGLYCVLTRRNAIGILMVSLLLGTPALSLIGAVGAALTLGLRGGGVLITLLVLPLYVPVLIFGAGGVEAVAGGLSAQGHLLVLGALSLGATVLAPWAIAAALRISME